MRALIPTSKPAEAIRAYQRLKDLLASELGTAPSSGTEALYLELLR